MYTVLIVEDEPTRARNLASFLLRYGYAVARAESGEEGLAQLETFQPDALLLDFNLPGMTGLEMMAELRRRDSRAKVILMTGHDSDQVGIDAMNAGAFAYFRKPVRLSGLKTVLDKAVGPHRLDHELAHSNRPGRMA